jgi:single-strand DNA-binding protein
MDTYITVTGNLTADPTTRFTASGATVVGFRVASSGRRFDREAKEFRDGEPLYISVSCWRNLGTNVAATLRKGDSVVVHGRMTFRTYDDKDRIRRSVHEIDALAVGPDLTRCPADLRRPQRPNEYGADTAAPPTGQTPGSTPVPPTRDPFGTEVGTEIGSAA